MNDYEDLRDDPRDYGNVLYNGQMSFNGTAALAKYRLKLILIADRARCYDPRSCIRTVEWPVPPQ